MTYKRYEIVTVQDYSGVVSQFVWNDDYAFVDMINSGSGKYLRVEFKTPEDCRAMAWQVSAYEIASGKSVTASGMLTIEKP